MVALFLLASLFSLQTVHISGKQLKRVCYFTNWSNKVRVLEARFYIKNIDPTMCTHLIYAFAKINTDSFRLNPTEVDDDNGSLMNKSGRYFEFTALKQKNPELVTLLSVGGASLSDGFIALVSSSHLIRLFARNCAIYLRDRNFDGLDVDWEFPGPTLKDQFTELIRALREEFEREAFEKGRPRLLLTIAAGVGEEPMRSYNITEIFRYVDFVNLMAYDFHGLWNGITAFSSPLYPRLSNYKFSPHLSQDWAVRQWLNQSMPADKLILGVSAAGLSFTLGDPEQNGVGAPIIDKGYAGPLKLIRGHLSCPEICQMLQNGADHVWDEEQKANYAYKDNQWVGFEDPNSIKIKTQYALDMGLGGMMLWSLEWDDFTGAYCQGGKYPLLSVIKEQMPGPTTTTTTIRPTTTEVRTSPTINSNPTDVFTQNIDGASMPAATLFPVFCMTLLCIVLKRVR